MDIINKEISKEAKVDVKFSAAKVQLEFDYTGQGAGAVITGYVSSDYLLDKLAAAIPGVVDDAIIAVLKSALNKL